MRETSMRAEFTNRWQTARRWNSRSTRAQKDMTVQKKLGTWSRNTALATLQRMCIFHLCGCRSISSCAVLRDWRCDVRACQLVDGQKKDTENTLEHNRSCAQSLVNQMWWMRALFWHNLSAADLEPSSCAHRSESRERNETITNKTQKIGGPRLTCRSEVMRQGRKTHEKNTIYIYIWKGFKTA